MAHFIAFLFSFQKILHIPFKIFFGRWGRGKGQGSRTLWPFHCDVRISNDVTTPSMYRLFQKFNSMYLCQICLFLFLPASAKCFFVKTSLYSRMHRINFTLNLIFRICERCSACMHTYYVVQYSQSVIVCVDCLSLAGVPLP